MICAGEIQIEKSGNGGLENRQLFSLEECVHWGVGGGGEKSVSAPAGGGYGLGGRSEGFFHGGVLNMFKNPV